MTIKQQAATALAHAQAAGVAIPEVDTAHLRRLRAALAREVTVMLGVPPANVVVTDDPQRGYGGYPGQLVTVHDPDDPATVLRFIPETGTSALAAARICCSIRAPGAAPIVSHAKSR